MPHSRSLSHKRMYSHRYEDEVCRLIREGDIVTLEQELHLDYKSSRLNNPNLRGTVEEKWLAVVRVPSEALIKTLTGTNILFSGASPDGLRRCMAVRRREEAMTGAPQHLLTFAHEMILRVHGVVYVFSVYV